MVAELDQKSLEQAFSSRQDIQGAIKAAAVTPAYIELFNQISLHICSLSPPSSEPASKKRRLDGEIPSRGTTNGHAAVHVGRASVASGNDPILLEIKDISVVVPQRKKYSLCFTENHLYARLPDSDMPAQGISYAWKDIERIFCLPVPEKSQVQHNYLLFPHNSLIPPLKPSPDAPPTPEPLVFTIAAAAPKPGSISGIDAAAASAVSDDHRTLFDWALIKRLHAVGKYNISIERADEKLFHSVQRQAHRPDEKAVHVRAFRGSKDGYLFFLPRGILWAFKKPLIFVPHERIVAVSYTSVLQRTFDLCVEIRRDDGEGEGQGEEGGLEIEFAMLDQEDFAGIDAYVKRYGLLDRSMAEQRRAKKANINVVKDEEGNVVGSLEAGELQKAGLGEDQQDEEIDEEDEEEEDYDPGSEGESEGEGSSTSEEEEDGDGRESGGDNESGEEEEDEG